MKSTSLIASILFVLSMQAVIYAQEMDALDYMNQFTAEYSTLQQDMWDYTRAVSHGRGASKVEKRRTELIATSDAALKKAEQVGEFEGSTEYRDAVVEYFRIINEVLKEDYERIVEMEANAEDSFENMESYMEARKAANNRQIEAAEMVARSQQMFANDNNIKLVASNDDLDNKMLITEAVYDHYNAIYLIFFKSHKQEMSLMNAIDLGDVKAVEEIKERLEASIDEGMSNLESVKVLENDRSMIEATQNLLTLYKKEAQDSRLAIDYLLKKEKFDTINKEFEAIKEKDRTQEDVDRFNNAIDDLNVAVEAYNETIEDNNEQRAKLTQVWNEVGDKFTDKHVPKGK